MSAIEVVTKEPKPLKCFEVRYTGLYLSGVAIVFDTTEARAKNQVVRSEEFKRTIGAILSVTSHPIEKGIAYNYDGDY